MAITEKRTGLIPLALEAEVLASAQAIAPSDPLGKGMVTLAKALKELRKGHAA